MRKFFVMAALAATLVLLAACGKVTEPPAPPEPPEPPKEERQFPFLVLVPMDEYEENPSRGWGWRDVPTLTEATVSDELAFVFGVPAETNSAELHGWRWSESDQAWVEVLGLPFVVEHDKAMDGGIVSLRWAPVHVGWYWFTLYLSDKKSNPLPGTPITLVVQVKRAPLPPCDVEVRWFNITYDLSKEIAEGEVNLNDSRNRGLSFNWSVGPSNVARVSITLNSREIYSSDLLTHAQWVAFSSLDVGRLVFRLIIGDPAVCEPTHERLIELNLVRR